MSTNSDEPKAVAISLFDRRVSAVAVTIVVIGAFLAALLWGLSIALAHHPTYVANTACDGTTTAQSTYVGGSGRRLVLISGVVINGQAYDATLVQHQRRPGPERLRGRRHARWDKRCDLLQLLRWRQAGRHRRRQLQLPLGGR